MPIDIKYLDNGLGVYWFGHGILTGQNIIEASKETFESEERLKQIKYALIDFTSIDKVIIANADIQLKFNEDERATEIAKDTIVALAASKDVMFGISRIWEAYVDELSWETNVFRSISKAKLWIKNSLKINITFK